MMELIDREKELARLNKGADEGREGAGDVHKPVEQPEVRREGPRKAGRGDPRQAGRRPGESRQDQGEHCGAGGKSEGFPVEAVTLGD